MSSGRRAQVTRIEPPVVTLAGGVADDDSPHTLYLQTPHGGYRATLESGFTLTFGRNEPDVHVCVGADDTGVSRTHGSVRPEDGRWVLRNEGRLPLGLPHSHDLLQGHEQRLPDGYTPLFIRTARHRGHLLEVFVTGRTAVPVRASSDRYSATTQHRIVALDAAERRLMVVLSQEYLRREVHPGPRSWSQVAEELNEIEGGAAWTASRCAHAVERIRERAAKSGMTGVHQDEGRRRTDSALKQNLIEGLLLSGTLAPPDLREIGEATDW